MSRIYWVVFWLAAILVNENLVQWALAVKVGGMGVSAGFDDAYRYFTPLGYAFFTLFRLIPYLILASFVKKSARNEHWATAGIAWGGLLGVAGMIVWGSWTAQHAFYTEAHVSSTTAISFLFIPIWAILTGLAGSVAGALVSFPTRKAG